MLPYPNTNASVRIVLDFQLVDEQKSPFVMPQTKAHGTRHGPTFGDE